MERIPVRCSENLFPRDLGKDLPSTNQGKLNSSMDFWVAAGMGFGRQPQGHRRKYRDRLIVDREEFGRTIFGKNHVTWIDQYELAEADSPT